MCLHGRMLSYLAMTKETLVFVLGISLAVLPFLGIPDLWKQYLVAGTGVILIITGYALRRDLFLLKIDRGNGERGNESFVETTKQLFDEREIQ